MNAKLAGALGIGALGVACLLVFGKEVMQEGSLGESRNPNYGRPSKPANGSAHGPKPDFRNLTKEQYYEGLKANRPDLSEQELRAKADHWWQVKMGEAKVTGG